MGWILNCSVVRYLLGTAIGRGAVTEAHQREVDRNYEEFQKLLPDLVTQYAGKFALMKDGKIIQYFSTARDAYNAGDEMYPDGLFSIQEVAGGAVDLGFFSHVIN